MEPLLGPLEIAEENPRRLGHLNLERRGRLHGVPANQRVELVAGRHDVARRAGCGLVELRDRAIREARMPNQIAVHALLVQGQKDDVLWRLAG